MCDGKNQSERKAGTYHLLIVDDEPMILAGLVGMARKNFEGSFLVYQAGSAEEALQIFRDTRIDLLMTDIQMPGMDGLEMARIVGEEWPDCLTIFLTGHSEFEYARRAVTERTVAYVLKLDGDKAICDVITKAYERLENEYSEKSRLLRMTESWKETLPLLRQDCFRQLVSGGWKLAGREKTIQRLKAAWPDSDPDGEFLMTLVCMAPEQDMEAYGQIQSVFQENLKGAFRICTAQVFRRAFLILAQAEDLRPLRLKGFVEIALSMTERMGIRVPQTYLYEDRLKLDELSRAFSILGRKRFEVEGEGGVFLCGADTLLPEYTWREDGPVMGTFEVERISDSLMYGKEADYMAVVRQIRDRIGDEHPEQGATAYITLASLLLQAVLNYLPREGTGLSGVDMEKIANYSEHRSFREACYYLESIAERYFAKRREIHADTDAVIVHKINSYILSHLEEDLSLPKLGEIVGLHPSYLSRIYKKTANQSPGQYITAQRLNAAKELLRDPKVRIQTVAERTGLNTASYFTHFFKKHTGMTPQEYRNRMSGTAEEGKKEEGQ